MLDVRPKGKQGCGISPAAMGVMMCCWWLLVGLTFRRWRTAGCPLPKASVTAETGDGEGVFELNGRRLLARAFPAKRARFRPGGTSQQPSNGA